MSTYQINEGEYPIQFQIIDILVQVMHKIAFIDKLALELCDGIVLSAVEIHLIDAIGRFPGDTITGLADRLGVTKGAVSQMVQKLETKDCVIRSHSSDNRKNISLILTEEGKVAFYWHKSLHDRINEVILSDLSDQNEQDLNNLFHLLKNLSNALDLSVVMRESNRVQSLER